MQLGITILCILVIIVVLIQLYRTLSWQKLINNKQADYVEAHVKSNTKQYVSVLATSFVFMCVINLPFANLHKSMSGNQESNDLAVMFSMAAENEMYEESKVYDGSTSEDGIDKAVAIIASDTNSVLEPIELLADFKRNDNNFTYSIAKLNENANEYSDDELLDYLEQKELLPTNEFVENGDYELIITNSENEIETYLIKEYDDCFIACNEEFGNCYYIKK